MFILKYHARSFCKNSSSDWMKFQIIRKIPPRAAPPHAYPREFSPTVLSRSPGKYGRTSNSGVLAVTNLFWGRLMGVFRNKQIDNQNIKYHEN